MSFSKRSKIIFITTLIFFSHNSLSAEVSTTSAITPSGFSFQNIFFHPEISITPQGALKVGETKISGKNYRSGNYAFLSTQKKGQLTTVIETSVPRRPIKPFKTNEHHKTDGAVYQFENDKIISATRCVKHRYENRAFFLPMTDHEYSALCISASKQICQRLNIRFSTPSQVRSLNNCALLELEVNLMMQDKEYMDLQLKNSALLASHLNFGSKEVENYKKVSIPCPLAAIILENSSELCNKLAPYLAAPQSELKQRDPDSTPVREH